MVKRFIKRYMPDEDKIKSSRSLRLLSPLLSNSRLWRFNRRCVARAFAVGLFCAFLPIPMQMLVAAFIAIVVNANIPISVGLVWFSNPITIPPIFYFTYKVGAAILQQPALTKTNFKFSVEWFASHFAQIWQPLILGSLICGTLAAAIGFVLVHRLWRRHIIHQWRQRQ